MTYQRVHPIAFGVGLGFIEGLAIFFATFGQKNFITERLIAGEDVDDVIIAVNQNFGVNTDANLN